MTRQEREVFWRERLERQAASGLSVRSWCALEVVSYTAFLYWRRRWRGYACGWRRCPV